MTQTLMIARLKNIPKTPWLVFAACLFFKWKILQALAWLWMLVSYSIHSGAADAWRMTFSGDFPCLLCRLVANGSTWESGLWSSVTSSPFAATLAVLPVTLVLTVLIPVILRRIRLTLFQVI
jgi:hypothetical protein